MCEEEYGNELRKYLAGLESLGEEDMWGREVYGRRYFWDGICVSIVRQLGPGMDLAQDNVEISTP